MNLTLAILLLYFCTVSAQQKPVKTLYFEFDRFDLTDKQIHVVSDFIKNIDTSEVESVQIYGYCDDRGSDNYNFKLSKKRARTIQNLLVGYGFDKGKIIILEGKGRIAVKADTIQNLRETRLRNRRVDLIVVKNNFGKGTHTSFKKGLKVGDKVCLELILFDIGSSKLTHTAKKVLDKAAVILENHQNLQFEIRGHVCCTPEIYIDAIDRATKERRLSWNRAKTVFHYLISKKISKSRMTYVGCGNKYPLKKGDKYDRRVEFVITKI